MADAMPPLPFDAVQQPLHRLRIAIEHAERELGCLRRAYLEATLSVPEIRPPTVFQDVCALSRQERRVAALLAHGRSNHEIAQALHVSVNTVKSHVQSILRKRSLRSRWQLLGAGAGDIVGRRPLGRE